MSARLRVTLLAGSALILALELPDLGRLLRHDLFGPRPALAAAHAPHAAYVAARAGVASLAALGLADADDTTGVRRDGREEHR